MSKPYYLDFNQIDNNHTDRLGRRFQTSSSIKPSQESINNGIHKKILDYTEKYKSCFAKDNPRQFLKVDSYNEARDVESMVPQNPHAFWGINNSQSTSIGSMSLQMLDMKQRQELTQLQNNSHYRPGLLEEIKMKHARERAMLLEASGDNRVNPGDQSNTERFTNINTFGKSSTCLNAQGEWQDINPHNYVHNNKNKYEHIKKMSPEMLNNIYGRPNPEPILPEIRDQGDIFDMTSLKYNVNVPQKLLQLKSMEQEARSRIMSEKSQLQSYNQNRSYNDQVLPYSRLL